MQTIRNLRTEKNWSQVILSSKADVSVGTINRMERGKPVNPAMLRRVCEALGVSPGAITGSPTVSRGDKK